MRSTPTRPRNLLRMGGIGGWEGGGGKLSFVPLPGRSHAALAQLRAELRALGTALERLRLGTKRRLKMEGAGQGCSTGQGRGMLGVWDPPPRQFPPPPGGQRAHVGQPDIPLGTGPRTQPSTTGASPCTEPHAAPLCHSHAARGHSFPSHCSAASSFHSCLQS